MRTFTDLLAFLDKEIANGGAHTAVVVVKAGLDELAKDETDGEKLQAGHFMVLVRRRRHRRGLVGDGDGRGRGGFFRVEAGQDVRLAADALRQVDRRR